LGNEVPCILRRGRESFAGKAFLEPTEILFRGHTRFKIALPTITAIDAIHGELRVRTQEGLTIFELGRHAESWRNKIINPKPLLAKLGVKFGESVSLLGDFPADFVASLKKWGAAVHANSRRAAVQTIFCATNQISDLRQLPAACRGVHGAMAFWVVFPKGQESITAEQVRSAGLAAGLVDIKVVSFSPTHTALKFVLPKSKR
jgi:hypothetical protein